MSKIKVIGWISNKDAAADKTLQVSIGGLGGFFNFSEGGMRWPDYIDRLTDEAKPYAQALYEEIKERKIRYTGEDHQNREDGVPLFSDNTIGSFSFRAWGDLMAAIWSDIEDKDYNYMNFYM